MVLYLWPSINLNYLLTMKKDTARPFSLIRSRMPIWDHSKFFKRMKNLCMAGVTRHKEAIDDRLFLDQTFI